MIRERRSGAGPQNSEWEIREGTSGGFDTYLLSRGLRGLALKLTICGTPRGNHQAKREEAVQGKGEASLWRPTSILERTRRFSPHVRSQGGPACPEDSGRTGHQRTASGWGDGGTMEEWNDGTLGKATGPPSPSFQYSIIPILLSPFRGWAAGFPNAILRVWGPFCQDFRPRRVSRRSGARTEPTGPKPTRPEKGRARLATGLNRLFSSCSSADTGCRETGDLL
jgi:hypothetical protein